MQQNASSFLYSIPLLGFLITKLFVDAEAKTISLLTKRLFRLLNSVFWPMEVKLQCSIIALLPARTTNNEYQEVYKHFLNSFHESPTTMGYSLLRHILECSRKFSNISFYVRKQRFFFANKNSADCKFQ